MGSLAGGWIIRMGGRSVTEDGTRIGDASAYQTSKPVIPSCKGPFYALMRIAAPLVSQICARIVDYRCISFTVVQRRA